MHCSKRNSAPAVGDLIPLIFSRWFEDVTLIQFDAKLIRHSFVFFQECDLTLVFLLIMDIFYHSNRAGFAILRKLTADL